MPGSAEANRQEYAAARLLRLPFSDDSPLKYLGAAAEVHHL